MSGHEAEPPAVIPRARDASKGAAPPEQRSRVSLWRSSNGKPKWSISIVQGATEDEVDRLVDLTLRAERRLTERSP